MKLRKKQKEALLQWIAEGLETGDINERAAKFKPRFKVSRSQVDYYRQTRDVTLDEIQEAAELDALKSGLALKDERVAVLQRLANKIIGDLLPEEETTKSKLWLDNKKAVGFEAYEYKTYNKAEVDSLREVLDDIASEVGQRVKKTDITTDGKPIGNNWKELRKNLSDEELAKIEAAAEIVEQAERDSAAAKSG